VAIARGVFIVIISQCQTGIVSSAYAAGAAFAQAGCVLGADMTPEGLFLISSSSFIFF
jgi:L-asparaginase/Glu-tRNA(Gln) amidotransferase subunit D